VVSDKNFGAIFPRGEKVKEGRRGRGWGGGEGGGNDLPSRVFLLRRRRRFRSKGSTCMRSHRVVGETGGLSPLSPETGVKWKGLLPPSRKRSIALGILQRGLGHKRKGSLPLFKRKKENPRESGGMGQGGRDKGEIRREESKRLVEMEGFREGGEWSPWERKLPFSFLIKLRTRTKPG